MVVSVWPAFGTDSEIQRLSSAYRNPAIIWFTFHNIVQVKRKTSKPKISHHEMCFKEIYSIAKGVSRIFHGAKTSPFSSCQNASILSMNSQKGGSQASWDTLDMPLKHEGKWISKSYAAKIKMSSTKNSTKYQFTVYKFSHLFFVSTICVNALC